jgi:mRNA-degrading endonuclease toxin of MazEF toxin-antitoxin module
LTNSLNCDIIISESEGTVMKRGDIYYVDLSPVVGNEVGGIRMCQIVEVYAEENLVRVRPMVKHPITNSNVFRKIHDRTVSIKRIKEFVKSA